MLIDPDWNRTSGLRFRNAEKPLGSVASPLQRHASNGSDLQVPPQRCHNEIAPLAAAIPAWLDAGIRTALLIGILFFLGFVIWHAVMGVREAKRERRFRSTLVYGHFHRRRDEPLTPGEIRALFPPGKAPRLPSEREHG